MQGFPAAVFDKKKIIVLIYSEVVSPRLWVYFISKSITIFTALSRSQSLNMISGDLPPSSSETFFRLVAALKKKKIM